MYSQDSLICNSVILEPIIKNYKNIDNFINNFNFNNIFIYYTTFNSELNITLYDTTEVILLEQIKVIKSKQLDIIYDISLISIINHLNKTIIFVNVKDSINNLSYVSNLLNLNLMYNIPPECCFYYGTYYRFIFNSLKFFQIPFKKSTFTFKININNFIDEVEENYPSKGNKVTFKKRFVYNNLELINTYLNIKDYLFVNNKLIKKYENYKILYK